jgi:hypothetical protein
MSEFDKLVEGRVAPLLGHEGRRLRRRAFRVTTAERRHPSTKGTNMQPYNKWLDRTYGPRLRSPLALCDHRASRRTACRRHPFSRRRLIPHGQMV